MHIIVCSVAHRSGSTLLQRIFNARKQTLIWGQHDRCLKDFLNIYTKIKASQEKFDYQKNKYFLNNEDPNTSIANMTPGHRYLEHALHDSIKGFFENFYEEYSESHDMIGFKEVLYGIEEISLFQKAFPDCKVVLLVRHPIDIWKSLSGKEWNPFTIESFCEVWRNNADDYIKLSKRNKKVTLVRYEDIVSKDEDTLTSIGKIGRLSLEEMNYVINKKISSSTKPITADDENKIITLCGKVMKKFHY
ncbi:Glu-tRNA(Gln) amidotransferase subunit E-like FAD-binding protein [Salibacterium salarium]|uniref:sulfotransferase n=1 Tax=Salibacterium salarium TaxID=284579 RepID=UPI002780FEB3|nr:sulfotransferase [Salibacterium salarium]MDQ0300706.1 Glu-tRNA(Gln) amidotransferase subunit E-like FAD-binding protein [Salibacterium salarium]